MYYTLFALGYVYNYKYENLLLTLWYRFIHFFFFLRAIPAAHGGSQARGLIGATVVSLRHSHSNTRSELHLRPAPQLMAMLDPQPTERGQGLNRQPHGSSSDSFPLHHDGISRFIHF